MVLSANTQIDALVDAARDMFILRPQRYWAQLRGQLDDLSGTNFKLACDFAARGAMRDAAMRFRIAVKLDPNFTQAWHNLGVCLTQLGDKERAAEAFQRVLMLDGTHEEARYLLATVAPGAMSREQLPTRMPRSIIERAFATTAPYYRQMEAQNQYAGAAICEQKTLPHLTTKTELQVLDLGCGVGLAAQPWRAKAARLTGVDIVPAMVAQAKAANVYDAVMEADINTADDLTITDASMDVVLLCNVAQFLGDLNAVMRRAARWLKPGGVMTLTVEPAVVGTAYGVHPATGKFGHSAAYLQDTAKVCGFTVMLQERVNLYPNVIAGIVVMRKIA